MEVLLLVLSYSEEIEVNFYSKVFFVIVIMIM